MLSEELSSRQQKASWKERGKKMHLLEETILLVYKIYCCRAGWDPKLFVVLIVYSHAMRRLFHSRCQATPLAALIVS